MAFIPTIFASATPTHQANDKCIVQRVGNVIASAALVFTLTQPLQAAPKLPPIDRTIRDRCVPSSSTIGQANAARDSLLDLRECELAKLSFHGDLSGALLAGADFTDADLTDAQLSKSYAYGAKFRNVDFTVCISYHHFITSRATNVAEQNGVLDRVDFSASDLSGAIFNNAVLSNSIFDVRFCRYPKRNRAQTCTNNVPCRTRIWKMQTSQKRSSAILNNAQFARILL